MKTVSRLSGARGSASRRTAAFTLIEVMMAAAVGALVLGAVASILVMSVRMAHKNKEIAAAATNTRLVQERINSEMSMAISQSSPVAIRPTFEDASDTTPARYARTVYRVPIGSFATVQSDTANTSSSIVVVCPSDIIPKAGDYFLMDTPDLGSGIKITAVSPENSSGPVTLTLQSTIHDASQEPDKTEGRNALAGALVRIQRERKYETVAPESVGLDSDSPVTELHWYESTANDDYVVLSRNVDSTARHLFAQVPEDTTSLEPAVSWQFSYVSSTATSYVPGGPAAYYQTNYSEGLIMPKSGNPLSTASILGGGSTTTSTTSTTTSTSTSTSTTTSSTTSKSTSTTSTSKTTTTSTTSKSTTTTSTSKTTSTSTTSISTTSKSTTSTSSKSTTSTSKSTTTSTTSKSTSSKSTSKSTSTSTSSKSTSSTSTSKTTSTSTTSKSTTSSTVTTSKSTTTSIPFDG